MPQSIFIENVEFGLKFAGLFVFMFWIFSVFGIIGTFI